ncbi:MAG: hypothetical protein AABX54_00330 [Nanoarchaeota archaeon]
MSGLLVSQTHAREIRRFLGTGLQPLKLREPSKTVEEIVPVPSAPTHQKLSLLCHYGVHGQCADVNRMSPAHCANYVNCRGYLARKRQEEEFERTSIILRSISDPLSDTVIMTAQDLIGTNQSSGKPKTRKLSDNYARFGYYERMTGNRLE